MSSKHTKRTPSETQELSALIKEGYELLHSRRVAEACDRWLRAWDLVKRLVTPAMLDIQAFDNTYKGLHEYAFNWCQELEQELGNAGLDYPAYHEHRIRYAREFLDRFPQTDDLMYLNFRRAEGEALWALGRRTEAEAVYAALVDRLPDDAWSYIGWADEYWLLANSPKDYARAEAILQRALARPLLTDRPDVLERLADLHEAWHGSDRAVATADDA